MSVLLAEATVKVTTDVSKVGSDAEEGIKKQSSIFGGIGTVVGGILGAQLVTAGVEGIKSLFAAGLDEAKEASGIQAQLNAGIASTGNAAHVSLSGMNDYAQSIQNMSGQSKNSIGNAQSLLLTFTNIKNTPLSPVFDEATLAAANLAARMGGTASDNAIKLGKALQDPENGLTALTRVGVTFTDGQKAQIKAMQDAGNMAGAQQIILSELNKEFGGSAEAAGTTLPGALSRLKLGFSGIGASIVTSLEPVAIPIIGKLADMVEALEPVIDKVMAGITTSLKGVDFGSLLDGVKAIAGPALEALHAFSPLTIIFDALKPSLPLIANLMGTIGKVLSGVLAVALPIVSQAVAMLSGVLGGVLKAVLPVIATLVEGLGKVLEKLLPVLSPIIAAVGQLAMAALPPLMSLFKMLVPVILQIANAFEPILKAILPPLLEIFKALSPVLKPLIDAFMQILAPVLQLITPLLSLITSILPPLMQLLTPIIDLIGKQLVTSVKMVTPILAAVGQVLGDVLSPVIKTVTNLLGDLIHFVTDVFSGNWKAAWHDIIKYFTDLWSGIGSIVKGVINGVIDLVNGMVGSINVVLKGIKTDTGGAINFGQIPKIPHLATGTNDSPGTFIAGENGPELITNAAHSTVRPYQATQDILARAGGNDSGVHYHFEDGAITVDAASIDDVQAFMAMLKQLPQVARSGPGTGKG